jgi:hypothetical protein
MSNHNPLRIVLASALVLILLWVAADPLARPAQAAKDSSITITADKQHVAAGDNDTLHIKLQNVKNATLDGVALKGDKINQKVMVCADTTYTVDATDSGGQKISQSLTIYATGTTAKTACLPDLAVKSMWAVHSPDAGNPAREEVDPNWIIENRGKTVSTPVAAVLTSNDGGEWDMQVQALKPGETQFAFAPASILRGSTRVYTLVIDPKNQEVESDKSNNAQTLSTTANGDLNAPKNAPLAPGLVVPNLLNP